MLTKYVILQPPQKASWSGLERDPRMHRELFSLRCRDREGVESRDLLVSFSIFRPYIQIRHTVLIYEWTFCLSQLELSVHLVDGKVMEGLWYSHVLRLGNVMMENGLAVR